MSPIVQKRRYLLSKNGNGHQGLYNPVKIFIRLVQGVWKKRDEVSGETYLVDSEVVESDLEDLADQPERKDNTDN